jgi:hypothetical protein
MGALLYPLVLIVGMIGFVAGLGRMLVLVGATLMGVAVLSTPDRLSKALQALPVDLSPQVISVTSMAVCFIGLPVLAALLLRAVYGLLRLPWFLDRALGAALGIVAGNMVRQWLAG